MANNDYQMLINLRNNVVALPKAKEAYEKARQDLNRLCEPKKQTSETDSMKREYLAQYDVAWYKTEKKLSRRRKFLWLLTLILIVGGCALGTVFLWKSGYMAACAVGAVASVLSPFLIWELTGNLNLLDVNSSEIKARMDIKKPDINLLYQSEEYRTAAAKENDQFEKDKQHYAEVKKGKELIVNKYWSVVAQCEKAIQNAPINASYKNIKMLDILLYYFNYNRAATLIDAVNQYAHDMQMRAFMDQMAKQHVESMSAISGMRTDMNANFTALMKEMEQSRRMNEAYQNSVLNQLSAIQREAANTAYYAGKIYRGY